MVPVVLHSLGAPLGEPFADDFDYLHRALFGGRGSFFDGYGSNLYWRPLGRQVYYGALSRVILANPGAIAALHVALLALAAWLLYRAFRPAWPGPAAAAMAAFPLWMESSRMLVAWPSHFMDLGALLFAALAIHEASRHRLPTAVAAMLSSLLCKEVGVATAMLLPWVPIAWRTRAGDPRRLGRWVVACAALVAAWTLVYLAACRHGGMSLPRTFDPATLATPLLMRYAWAVGHSVRAGFSLAAAPGRWDAAILGSAAACLALALVTSARRGRLVALWPGLAWGAAWFFAASAALTEVYPVWDPYRAVYGSLGLGVALVALCESAHPAALAGLVAIRLAAFALSPGPPALVADAPTERGDAFDFERLVRLERLIRETRVALEQRFPLLPHGARVGLHYMPRLAGYAFTGDKSLQVWYGDSTAHWVRLAEMAANPEASLTTVVQFQPRGSPQIVLVEAAAMRSYLEAMSLISQGRTEGALPGLSRADSLQRDRRAGVFLGLVAGRRARALLDLGRADEAERVARVGASEWGQNVFAHLVIARVRFARGDLAQASAHVDSVLRFQPHDAEALELRSKIREGLARGAAPRRAGLGPRGRPGPHRSHVRVQPVNAGTIILSRRHMAATRVPQPLGHPFSSITTVFAARRSRVSGFFASMM